MRNVSKMVLFILMEQLDIIIRYHFYLFYIFFSLRQPRVIYNNIIKLFKKKTAFHNIIDKLGGLIR